MSLSSPLKQELVTKMLSLASQHQLDPNRVESVAVRLGEVESVNGYYPLFNVLEKSIEVLGPTEALHYLESEDLERLAQRVATLRFLTRHDPLYRLDELASLATAMKIHLENNRQALLETGYPHTSFGQSLWLDYHCNRLYPTKLPVTVQGSRPLKQLEDELAETVDRDRVGDLSYAYTWAKQSALGTKAPQGNTLTPTHEDTGTLMIAREYNWTLDEPRSEDLRPVDLVPYEEAALIDGLGARDAARLEGLREPVFHLKMEILEHLQWAALARTIEGFWARCLKSMTNKLRAYDADYLLTCDKLYELIHPGWKVFWFPVRSFFLTTGGLSDLLRLIGHYEAELTIGSCHKLCEALTTLPFSQGPPISYYEALGHPRQADLDSALDQYLALEEQKGEFEKAFRQRVNKAIAEDFSVPITVVVPGVARKHGDLFTTRIEGYAHYETMCLTTTGNLSAPQPPIPTSASPPLQNQAGPFFRQNGEMWTISYEDRTVHLKCSIGLRYLEHLLKNPKTDIPVEQLAALVSSPTIPNEPTTFYDQMTEEESADGGMRIVRMGDAGEVLDEKAQAAYRQSLHEIEREIEEAKKNNDLATLDRLKKDQAFIQAELAKARGFGGRNRKLGDVSERIRKTVTKAIQRSLQQIQTHHPALGQHLIHAIHTGTLCSYNPHPPVPWEF